MVFLQNQADCSNFLMNVIHYVLLSQIECKRNFKDNIVKCAFLAYEHEALRNNLQKKNMVKNLIVQCAI